MAEFRESPFANAHLRYSTLVDFNHGGARYSVGDFIRCSSRTGVFRIERLFYTTTQNLDACIEGMQPPLWLQCSCWTISRDKKNCFQTPNVMPVQFAAGNVLCAVTLTADIPKPLFRAPLVTNGCTCWIEIFIDGFRMGSGGGSPSSCGIYVSLSNIQRHLKHVQSFVGTLFLLPPGVDPLSVMWRVSQDLVALQNGISVWDSAINRWTTVHGFVSLLIADHMQAIDNTRALGNAATLIGRCCWASKQNRVDKTMLRGKVFLDHKYTRRDAQTDACVTQMETVLLTQRRTPTKKTLQSRYGVRAVPRMFSSDVQVDVHTQSPWDASHLLWQNWAPHLLNKLSESMPRSGNRTQSYRMLLQARIALFTRQRGMSGMCSRPWKPGVGRSVPMSVWQVETLFQRMAVPHSAVV